MFAISCSSLQLSMQSFAGIRNHLQLLAIICIHSQSIQIMPRSGENFEIRGSQKAGSLKKNAFQRRRFGGARPSSSPAGRGCAAVKFASGRQVLSGSLWFSNRGSRAVVLGGGTLARGAARSAAPAKKNGSPGGRGNAPRSGVPAANAFLSLSGFLLQNPSEFLSDSNDAGIGI